MRMCWIWGDFFFPDASRKAPRSHCSSYVQLSGFRQHQADQFRPSRNPLMKFLGNLALSSSSGLKYFITCVCCFQKFNVSWNSAWLCVISTSTACMLLTYLCFSNSCLIFVRILDTGMFNEYIDWISGPALSHSR